MSGRSNSNLSHNKVSKPTAEDSKGSKESALKKLEKSGMPVHHIQIKVESPILKNRKTTDDPKSALRSAHKPPRLASNGSLLGRFDNKAS